MRFMILLAAGLACLEKPEDTGDIQETDTDTDTATDTDTDTDTDTVDLAAGQFAVESSCTNACHSGQNMGNRSSRFPDDTELASVIRGQIPGPMQGIGAANSWSDSDMSNAIAYMRSLE